MKSSYEIPNDVRNQIMLAYKSRR